MDTDGGELISFEEFMFQDRGRELKRLKSADTDGNNYISRVEMEAQL